jgi:outer membrane immunogenic protein
MKKLLLGSVAILALAIPPAAHAADLPAAPAYKAPAYVPAPVWNWNGFYLGVEGGGGWARTNQADTSGVTTGNYNQSGGLAGGTAGWNWQFNNFVFGLEGDLSWANINGTVSTPICAGGTCFTNLQWFATERARAGFTWGQFLVYATGGAAEASIKAGQDACGGVLTICGTNSRLGWTVGGGVEAMFAPNWSAKLEYLYADFGTHTSYTPIIPVNVTERVNIVRAGINYHFNWGGPVVARY